MLFTYLIHTFPFRYETAIINEVWINRILFAIFRNQDIVQL